MTERFYTTTAQIEEARPLWENAVLLVCRNGDFFRTELYQLDGSYIEVVWHSHFNVVVRVTSFNDTGRLDPFLSDISLEGLLD